MPKDAAKKYVPQIEAVPEGGDIEEGEGGPNDQEVSVRREAEEDFIQKKFGLVRGDRKRDILATFPLAVFFNIIIWIYVGASGNTKPWSEHWPMSLVMILGSLVGGGTAFGEGAVTFPFMTLAFDVDHLIARDYTFMIQATGMGCAAITMLLAGISVDYMAVAFSSLGGLVGVVIGLEALSDALSPGVVKMVFISLVLGIAWGLFYLNQLSDRRVCERVPQKTWQICVTLVVLGIFGGLVCGISGSGIDIIVFGGLAILFRVSEKVSCATSVVIGASNSLIAFVYRETVMRATAEPKHGDVYDYWLVTAPIAVIFAPIGAQLAARASRLTQARIVYFIAVIQFIFKPAVIVPKYSDMFLLYVAAIIVLFSTVAFTLLMHAGGRYDQFGEAVQQKSKEGDGAETDEDGKPKEAWADKEGSRAGSVSEKSESKPSGTMSMTTGGTKRKSKGGGSVLSGGSITGTSLRSRSGANWNDGQLSGATKLFQRSSRELRYFTYVFCAINAVMCVVLLIIQNTADLHVNESVESSLDRMDAVHNASYCHELLSTASQISEYGHSYDEEQIYFANAPCGATTVGSFNRLHITEVEPLHASEKYFAMARSIEFAALNDHEFRADIILGFEFYRSTLKHAHEEMVFLQDEEHEAIYWDLTHTLNYELDISIPVIVILLQVLATYVRRIVFKNLNQAHTILLEQLKMSEQKAKKMGKDNNKKAKANKVVGQKASSSVVAWLDVMQLLMVGLAVLQLAHVTVLEQTITDTQTTGLSTLSFTRDVAADGEVLYRKAWLEVHQLTDNPEIVLSDDSLILVIHPTFSAFGAQHEHLVELVEEAEEVHDHFLYEVDKIHDAVEAENRSLAVNEMKLAKYDHDHLDEITHELQDELRLYKKDVLSRLSVSHNVSLAVSILILVLTVVTVYQVRANQKKREKSDKAEQATLAWPLDAVLEDKVMKKGFLMFALSRHCQEMVKFHMQVESLLRKISKQMPCQSGIKRLYRRFLEPGSPDEINISHELSLQVRSVILKDWGKSKEFVSDDKLLQEMQRIEQLLQECRDEVFKLMADNLYQPFIRDPQFEPMAMKRTEELEKANLNRELLADADLDD